MNDERKYLESIFARMKEGERVDIDARLFARAYPVHPLFGIYRTPREHFLSNSIGSAWGCWTCELDPVRSAVVIGKHPAGDKRVYVDPDREDWYDKLPTGEYVPKHSKQPGGE